ncbi:MAG: HRDC domain-containing protein [Kiritimatiellia bacterium]|nr:HRDC domain-containing protein [Kiritimatiellia bacterium]
MTPTLITTAAGLAALNTRLLCAEAVALDTEFFWERTFYPVLGLVQLATPDGCWLADVVRLGDLSALAPLIASPSVTKVLHDAPQDLAILARATGAVPRSVFDTRLAAGFAGLSATLSLQALLQAVLGVAIAKGETRSDWLRRPLSDNQIRYAAEDVLHLIPLRAALLERCAGKRARGWLDQELARLDDPSRYGERPPEEMFRRVKGAARLNPRQLALLREVADWREREARRRDWPRSHVLPDPVMVSVALQGPSDARALAAVPDFPSRMPVELAGQVLAAVERGKALPESACPEPSGRNPAAARALKAPTDRLLAHLRAACEKEGIDPGWVASRGEAESLVQSFARGDASAHPFLRDWRQTLLAGFTL